MPIAITPSIRSDSDRNALVVANLKLVRWTIRRLRLHTRRDYDDLYQEGVLGLIRAAARFDETRGVRFSTLAVNAIRWRITDYINTRAGMIPLSCQAKHRAVSLDDHAAEVIADHRTAESGSADTRTGIGAELAEAVETALARLPDHWARLLRERWVHGRTRGELAAEAGITASAVRQMEVRAAGTLKETCPGLAEMVAGV